jgi:protease-4
VIVFVVLVAVALAAAVGGILLARGGARPLGKAVVLTWKVDGPILEQAPAADSLPVPGYEPPASVASLYRAFRAARADAGVRGIAVHVGDPAFGLAKAQEFRRQLLALRQAGKFAHCYLETAGEGGNGTLAYYLATACETIALAPSGEVNLLGLRLDAPFARGTLEKLRIHPDFVTVGEYKSAAEVFTEYEFTPPAREAIATVLDGDYRQLIGAIAESRELDPARVAELIDGAPYDAEQALAAGLVDQLAYPDEFRSKIEALGAEARQVRLVDYRGPRPFRGRRLAVVFAQGTILRGTGGVQPWSEEIFLGSADLGELLRELGEDHGLQAVVLRIDSPGGSALASDLILREVSRLAEVKPVVASFSDVAASGGYYIAARATRIVAEAGTLTGSIGVVGGKFVTRRFQEELLGVRHETLQRGANADLYSGLDPYTPAQRERVERLMGRVYDTFVDHVAAGRDMERSTVEEVARGRVWTGEDARRLGLVDELGGLDRAIDLARDRAGIRADESVRLEFYPRSRSLLELLVDRHEPDLPAGVARLLAALEPREPLALELPPDLARLARPF